MVGRGRVKRGHLSTSLLRVWKFDSDRTKFISSFYPFKVSLFLENFIPICFFFIWEMVTLIGLMQELNEPIHKKGLAKGPNTC